MKEFIQGKVNYLNPVPCHRSLTYHPELVISFQYFYIIYIYIFTEPVTYMRGNPFILQNDQNKQMFLKMALS